jgi:peptidyl-dipeptidase Dcp
MISLKDITIRNNLEPGDIGYITYLHGKLYAEEFGYGVDFEAYVARGLHEFYVNYQQAKDGVWICEHNQKVVGFLALMNRGKAAQLRYFIILPEYRGIGLGNKLMEIFLQYLEEAGYRSAYLLTSPELEAATHLYRKFGFSLVEEVQTVHFEQPELLHKYELNL